MTEESSALVSYYRILRPICCGLERVGLLKLTAAAAGINVGCLPSNSMLAKDNFICCCI